jgi:hypothetical protein
MSQIPDGPILDYASPMIRAPLRLAEKSIITFVPDPDGMRILESLAGKGRALFAIFFSAGSMTVLGCTISGTGPGWTKAMAVYAVFAIGTLALIVALINSNWQETILKISGENLLLVFKTPFKSRRYQWTREQIREARIVQELDPPTQRIVLELQIEFFSQPVVRLFTGHDIPVLRSAAEHIRQYLAGPPSDSAASAAS